jgi:hypothetical protein
MESKKAIYGNSSDFTTSFKQQLPLQPEKKSRASMQGISRTVKPESIKKTLD